MSVIKNQQGVIELRDECLVEDADVLLQLLLASDQTSSRMQLDWRHCTSAHTAIIQILLINKVVPLGPPASEFLRDKVVPLLERAMS